MEGFFFLPKKRIYSETNDVVWFEVESFYARDGGGGEVGGEILRVGLLRCMSGELTMLGNVLELVITRIGCSIPSPIPSSSTCVTVPPKTNTNTTAQ